MVDDVSLHVCCISNLAHAFVEARVQAHCPLCSVMRAALQVCGEGQGVEGDGVVPLQSAMLEGAEQVIIDGVFHSMSRLGTFDEPTGECPSPTIGTATIITCRCAHAPCPPRPSPAGTCLRQCLSRCSALLQCSFLELLSMLFAAWYGISAMVGSLGMKPCGFTRCDVSAGDAWYGSEEVVDLWLDPLFP
jgi:hypothetical protein